MAVVLPVEVFGFESKDNERSENGEEIYIRPQTLVMFLLEIIVAAFAFALAPFDSLCISGCPHVTIGQLKLENYLLVFHEQITEAITQRR